MNDEGVRALNGVCPYYTMFPISFPLSRLKRAHRRDWVLDPFCGRGSTNYAARLRGLNSLGVDSNPVASAIADSKFTMTSPGRVVEACLQILSKDTEPTDMPRGEFWRKCYNSSTLREICLVREALLRDRGSHARRALRGIVLGALHGPIRKKGPPDYLSNQMPRTYASKPAYAVRYWDMRELRPPRVSLLDVVSRRASRYLSTLPREVDGGSVCGDSRVMNLRPHIPKARWIVTSPPYYGMRTYVADQWLRNWFVGGPERPVYSASEQLSHASPEEFSHQLGLVWRNVASVASDDAHMVIRFGGIRDRHHDPRVVLKESIRNARDCGWRVRSTRPAGLATTGKRQAEQFGLNLKTPIAEYDFVVKMSR